MTNSPPTLQQAAQELWIRRRARESVLDYAQAIEIPGKPIGEENPDTEFFRPIETTMALHHRIILETMDRISKTPHGRAMFFMPPGSAKSTYASVVFPSRYLGAQSNRKVILASYGDDLARKMGRRTRSIIKQQRFKGIFGCELTTESTAAQEFSLTNGSEYISAGILGGITGNRANGIIIDDPVKGREQADSPTIRDKTWEAYESDIKTRIIPGGWMVLIQCMTGDTPVLFPDGTEKPLRDIRPGDVVSTFKDGQLSSSIVKNWASNGLDRVFAIKMTSGKIVRANERHPFLAFDSGELKWIKTKDLRPGQKILRVNGVSGKAKSAPGLIAIFQSFARAIAHLITIRNGGLMAYVRRHVIKILDALRISNTATELLLPTTSECSLHKMESAPFASSHPATMCERIGAGSCALITATIAKRLGRFCAMTATLLSGMQKLQKLLWPQPNISDFTPEAILEINPDGIEEVFDVQIYGTENFIANGLVSHNTRWHEDDLSGRILPENWKGESGKIMCRDGNEWEVVCLQARCEVSNDPLGRKIGEYLWPEWFDRKHWSQFESNPRTWASLYQQLPRPLEGTLFSVEKMLVDGNPIPFPSRCDAVFAVIDSALKTGDKNDGTGVTYFARNRYVGVPLIILDWDITQIEGDLIAEWFPSVMARLSELGKIVGARMGSIGTFVEDKGSGITLLQRSARMGWPAHAIDSKLTSMSKDARGTGVSDFVHHGKIKLSEHAYNKMVEYKGRTQNHFLSQFFGYRLGVPNQADDLYDTGVYGISIALGDGDGL